MAPSAGLVQGDVLILGLAVENVAVYDFDWTNQE